MEKNRKQKYYITTIYLQIMNLKALLEVKFTEIRWAKKKVQILYFKLIALKVNKFIGYDQMAIDEE